MGRVQWGGWEFRRCSGDAEEKKEEKCMPEDVTMGGGLKQPGVGVQEAAGGLAKGQELVVGEEASGSWKELPRGGGVGEGVGGFRVAKEGEEENRDQAEIS